MATQTSKGLIKPADTDLIDVAVLNANSDRVNDFAMGAYVCTSTTRPTGSNLWDGMLIKETDTELTLIWSAARSSWRYVAGPAVVAWTQTAVISTGNGSPWDITSSSSLFAGLSKNASYVCSSLGPSQWTLADDGVYTLHAYAGFGLGFNSTTRAFIAFSTPAPIYGGGSNNLARNSFGVTEDTCSVSFTGLLPAGQVIQCNTWQNSGGPANRNDMRVIISRIA